MVLLDFAELIKKLKIWKGDSMSRIVAKFRISSCSFCKRPIVEGELYKQDKGLYYHRGCYFVKKNMEK